MLYWVNKYRKSTRCLSWRWRVWRAVRCTWPYWHAEHSKWHCDERRTHLAWLVKRRPPESKHDNDACGSGDVCACPCLACVRMRRDER